MTIKETAGKVLLYLYQLQRTAPLTMAYRQVGFMEKKDGGVALSTDKKAMTKDLFDINSSPSDIFNAFAYLLNKEYVETKERTNAGTRIYVGLLVTDTAIDLIEGIEGGDEGRRIFETAFNIKVDGRSTVDSLIRDKLSALINNN